MSEVMANLCECGAERDADKALCTACDNRERLKSHLMTQTYTELLGMIHGHMIRGTPAAIHFILKHADDDVVQMLLESFEAGVDNSHQCDNCAKWCNQGHTNPDSFFCCVCAHGDSKAAFEGCAECESRRKEKR